MPCCFSFEYNQKKYSCQFSKERTFYRHDGKLYCEFHLPLSARIKKNCTPEQRIAFYSRLQSYIDDPVESEFAKELQQEGKIQGSLIDLSGVCFPHPINFNSTPFPHSTSFYLAHFDECDVSFSHSSFHGEYLDFRLSKFSSGAINFQGVNFGQAMVDFRQSEFVSGTLDFSHCQFGGKSINFYNTHFGDCEVYFDGAHLGGNVDFWNAAFNGNIVSFVHASFYGESVSFAYTNFGHSDIRFDQAQFNCESIDFSGANLGTGHTTFINTRFKTSDVNFSNIQFVGKRLDFSNALFAGGINLDHSKLHQGPIILSTDEASDLKYVSIKGSDVRSILSFEQRHIDEYIDLSDSTFYQTPSFWQARLPQDVRLHESQFLDTSFTAKDSYQKLANNLKTTTDHDREKVEDIQYLQYLCRLNDPAITLPEKWILLSYNATSKFGLSITRPVLSFFFLTCLMYITYFFVFLGASSLSFCENSSHSTTSCVIQEIKNHHQELSIDVLNFTLMQSFTLFNIPSPYDPRYCEPTPSTHTSVAPQRSCQLLVPHLRFFEGRPLMFLKLLAIGHSVLNCILLILFLKGLFWWLRLQAQHRHPGQNKLA